MHVQSDMIFNYRGLSLKRVLS